MIRKVLIGGYVAAVVGAGCGEVPLPQDMCNWLADENNCLQRFSLDVGEQCGGPFLVDSDPSESTRGSFATRDKLDICSKSAGGQVVFDPPLDLAAFPLTTAAFKLLDAQALPCGSGTFAAAHSYSISIDAAAGATPSDPVTGGTFAITATPGTQATYQVSCPGNVETHDFNSLILTKCPSRIPFQPTAVLESSPGIPESGASPSKAGFVRFRVEYPPTDIDSVGATPTVVEYFNCAIPAPLPPCEDGVKNGNETAIDCGGDCATNKGLTCAAGQGCSQNADCVSAKCGVVSGIKKCE